MGSRRSIHVTDPTAVDFRDFLSRIDAVGSGQRRGGDIIRLPMSEMVK
jgi:hypothetical protein